MRLYLIGLLAIVIFISGCVGSTQTNSTIKFDKNDFDFYATYPFVASKERCTTCTKENTCLSGSVSIHVTINKQGNFSCTFYYNNVESKWKLEYGNKELQNPFSLPFDKLFRYDIENTIVGCCEGICKSTVLKSVCIAGVTH